MIYDFKAIEEAARKKWNDNKVYKTANDSSKPKYFVLDMFPYPSGAGLHVGHPLGYIFSDIYARYKRMKGFNVLHPMGFDAFGLPAEQYAIQTGQHPAVTTTKNIETFKSQLDKIGFCYDWDRQVSTCDPKYYKWTQWIFLQLFESWFNNDTQSADDIKNLISIFENEGNKKVNAAGDDKAGSFSSDEWSHFSALEKQNILMSYRLAYQSESFVNWCPGLGTVLANDEVVNGVSERGGFPVEKKKMSQWFLRITAYAERLLKGLDTLDWTESIKEQQRNWIGKSTGAMVSFQLDGHPEKIDVFTTRVDTIFGVTFMVIAPEHDLVAKITTPEFKEGVDAYVKMVSAKSDIERQAEKQVTGQFTGAFVLHPFLNVKVPVYIADYVLAGYGTGAVMAVPSGDQRDYLFAEKFGLEKPAILDAQKNLDTEADSTKEGKYINSDFINGLEYKEATSVLIKKLEEKNIGKGKIQFRMRDAGYSRQRYWGEPFPIYYDKDDLIHTISDDKLPVKLPDVDSYKPTGTGESPLANATEWETGKDYVDSNILGGQMETDTMPGYAGSSWYFLRYMDPHNDNEFCSKEASDYWENVDFYVGGSEHAVGHLLYSRLWHKFLKDKGLVKTEEPFKKMVNQGMIQGVSKYVRVKFIHDEDENQIRGYDKKEILPHNFNIIEFNRTINNAAVAGEVYTLFPTEFTLYKSGKYYINQTLLDAAKLKYPQVEDLSLYSLDSLKYEFPEELDSEILAGNYEVRSEVEKMSKSKLNVENPDEIINQHGADCFRMYEMFLGPIDTAKPWDTNGISGVSNFIRKFWRLFYDDEGKQKFTSDPATEEEWKIVHKCIKKVGEDIERQSFNTCISSFMIAVNDYGKIKQPSIEALELLIRLICPFAPHTAEILWEKTSRPGFALDAQFPIHDEKYLLEDTIVYPVQVNGKLRANVEVPKDMQSAEIEQTVLANEQVTKYFDGKTPKKIIVVPGRIVNIVL